MSAAVHHTLNSTSVVSACLPVSLFLSHPHPHIHTFTQTHIHRPMLSWLLCRPRPTRLQFKPALPASKQERSCTPPAFGPDTGSRCREQIACLLDCTAMIGRQRQRRISSVCAFSVFLCVLCAVPVREKESTKGSGCLNVSRFLCSSSASSSSTSSSSSKPAVGQTVHPPLLTFSGFAAVVAEQKRQRGAKWTAVVYGYTTSFMAFFSSARTLPERMSSAHSGSQTHIHHLFCPPPPPHPFITPPTSTHPPQHHPEDHVERDV